MEDDIAVRRLVEILVEFFTHKVPVKEDLACSLTSEFLRNMQDVLFTKNHITLFRWQDFLASVYHIMVSSPKMYLTYVIYPSLQEAYLCHNIFERFLNSFALITRINAELWMTKRLDFSRLTADSIMVLYEKEYRKRFLKRGGFHRLVEYVNNPKYLDSNCVVRNISETYEFYTTSTVYQPDFLDKLAAIARKEKKRFRPRKYSCKEVEDDRHTSSLVKKVLNALEHEHAPKNDSTQQTPTKIEKESNRIVETTEKENFDSGTARQISDITQYESIIDAVIRHNQAKTSGQVKSASRIQKEADGTLEHLKNKIKSLMEALDNDRN